MRFLFVMDPIDTIHVEKDTTLVMMIAAQERGHEVHYCRVEDLEVDGTTPKAAAWPVTVRRVVGDHATLGIKARQDLAHYDVICMRRDPPVDTPYAHATRLMEMAPKSTLVVNDPRALRDCNEKLYALQFRSLVPRSMVSSDRSRLAAFTEEIGGRAVAKPLDGFGGVGVFILDTSDANRDVILETLTEEGRRPILVQEYLDEVRTSGDKRLIVVQGEPLGAVRRLPTGTDFRSNVHSGGRTVAADVDARDREICRVLRDDFRRRGILFAGLDVIGGYLTEINITSPTLIQEHAILTGVHLENDLIAAIEDAAKRAR